MKTAQDRFDDLVSLYLDEALDPEGVEELSRLVAARAPLAARFVRLSRVHGCLRQIEAPGASERMLKRRASRRRRLAFAWAVVAAAALLGFLLILWKL